MTRMDGDARGGAALSMRAVTGRADQADRVGREARCAGGVSSGAGGGAHPRDGRRAWPGRDGPARRSTRKRPKNLPSQDGEGEVRSRGLCCKQLKQISARWGACPRSSACCRGHGQAARTADRGQANLDTKMLGKRQAAIIGSMTRKDRAADAGDHQGEPQEADRGGQSAQQRAGREPAAEAVRRHVRR